MKILFVSEYFYPRQAGGEVWSWELCTALARRGHDITVLTQRDNPRLKKKEMIQKVTILRLTDTTPDAQNRIARRLAVGRFINAAKEELVQRKPDLVHVMAYTLNAPISSTAEKLGIPCVTSAHSYFGDDWPQIFPLNIVLRRLEKKTLQNDRSSSIHVPSEYLKKKIRREANVDTVVIHNWLVEKFPAPKKFPKKTLLFVGSLEKIKNPLACIPIAKKFDMPLLIIGSGTLEEQLLRAAEKANISCTLVPSATREQTLSCIGGATLVLIPSLSESFSLVALEAVAQGTPVSGTPVGILPELKGVSAFPPKRIPARLSKKIREQIKKEFSKEKIITEFEAFYKKAMR